jgi:adenosylmethionine---8-amino-7-oxononanoate aminotransferase
MTGTNMSSYARDFAACDKKNIWHPFTQMKEWANEDIIIIEKVDGCYLIDTAGRRYIDGVASLWTNVHGHGNKEINEALKRQIDEVAHSTFLGLSNVPAIILAEKLVSIVPNGLTRVFYSDSGSEAVEVALKVAYQYWCQKSSPERGRTKFIHLNNSYHGDTLGSVSVGGMSLFHAMYKPLLFETITTPAPYCYRCPYNLEKNACSMRCLEEMERIIKEHHQELAAVIVEPLMQGAAGMIQQPRGFITKIREFTKKYNTLLIFDEVATGFGRTGKMFAAQWENVSPDVLVLGKGITGGYLPLSATMFTEEIFSAFLGKYSDYKTFFHGHTYTGNQLAARAACANLEVFEKERTLEVLAPKIKLLKKRLGAFAALDHVGDIRQVGFMVGIELVKHKKTKEPYMSTDRIGHKVILKARERGVLIRPLGDVIVLMPPLSIPETVLEELIQVVFSAIKEITQENMHIEP